MAMLMIRMIVMMLMMMLMIILTNLHITSAMADLVRMMAVHVHYCDLH